MTYLKKFNLEDWKHLNKWITNESELVQFSGEIFKFPIDQKQVELYLSEKNRTVFKITSEKDEVIGISEIISLDKKVAKLARILIGEKSMRGQGVGTQTINNLTEFCFNTLKKEKIILNVFSWNIGAIKCYEKAGYTKSKKPFEIVKVGNEKWQSIEMEKILAAKTK